MEKKILIIGSKGMLGQELVKMYTREDGYDVTAWDKEDVDVTDVADLKGQIMDLYPDVIYNAVAYNAVDACEEDDIEYDKAVELNVDLPRNLAQIAKTLQATLVHYSTDYVFDGKKPVYKDGGDGPQCCGSSCRGCMYRGDEDGFEYFAYAEDDLPRPLSRYGKTKYEGEREVEKHATDFYIFRLSKLFGAPAASSIGKKSFFDMMQEKGREAEKSGETIKAVHGEMSKFTYAPDLARESKAIIEDGEESGIYHIVNDGACTWYDGVKTLYDILGINVNVEQVTPDTWPRPAKRPDASVLSVTKRLPLRHYKEALYEYLNDK